MIIAPVITEKSTRASVNNQVVFKVAQRRDQAADQGGRGAAVLGQGQGREHVGPQGQAEGVQRHGRALQSDVKKAVVTLEPGHMIDVMTGL